ncbi:MAG: carbonic anhydrase family protein [Cyanobacteriota bacterium]
MEATDKLDTLKRHSPPNKELIAQGIGNTISGLIGGLPITSVIVRSSVNINNGAKSKLSAIFHGVLLLLSALFIPNLLNKIPLACLAGILIVTGFKLTKLSLYKKMIKKGFNNYLPFFITIVAILFTDLLIGVIVGLVIGLLFILKSNLNNPFAFVREDYHEGEIIRLELSQQLSFLNKASIVETLEDIPENSKLIFDATNTDYIDSDILDVINDFRDVTSKIKNIDVNLVGFKEEYKLDNHIQFVNVLTKEIQERLEPEEVLDILMKGNQRFIDQKPNKKEYHHQIDKTSDAQHPMAVILSCIDSRTAAELIFDLGFGDIFSIRLAGNVINEDALGGLEFSCKVSGAKVILVLGHTNCGAIKAACSNFKDGNITHIMEKIDPAIEIVNTYLTKPDEITKGYLYEVTKVNVLNTVKQIQERSETIKDMVKNNKIIIQGGIYDIKTGKVEILKI